MELGVRECTIIIIWVVLIYNNILILERITIFIIFLGIIMVYKEVLKISERVIDVWVKRKEEGIEEGEVNEEEVLKRMERVIKILARIYNYKNPVIMIIVQLEIRLYYMLAWVNYKLINHLRIRNSIYIMITGLIFMPVKIILVCYYKFWKRMVERTLAEIIFKRAEGVIIGVLIMSRIMNEFISCIRGYEIIVGYAILVIISIILIFLERD